MFSMFGACFTCGRRLYRHTSLDRILCEGVSLADEVYISTGTQKDAKGMEEAPRVVGNTSA